MFSSYMPVRIFSGKGCVSDNYKYFAGLGSACLIVTSGRSARLSGALGDIVGALEKCSIKYEVFDSVTENPYTLDCFEAGKRARSLGADFIVGIGGGSPLDAAKAVAIYASNAELAHSDIYKLEFKNKPLPLVLVGTTAGTGSEVTGVSVLTNSDNGLKKSISGSFCYAEAAFCDYSYTSSVPYSVTVSTMLDAFAHAVESYFASNANELSDAYALKALELLNPCMKHFLHSDALPDEEMRKSLYSASIFAGLCLNITGTCFPHTLGYVLTEEFNIPHGKACAYFERAFLSRAKEYLPEKHERLLNLFSLGEEELYGMLDALTDVSVTFEDSLLDKCRKRWSSPIANFNRTPGGFDAETAVSLLK